VVLSCIFILSSTPVQAFSPSSSNDNPFSLSAYQKARAKETSAQLDASRFHFQILFVDDNNFHGRIAEGILAKIAEYNDALFTLFPYSATISSSPEAPYESTAPEEAMAICESLGLCSVKCGEDGTSFNLSYFDEYDLIIALNDEVQSLLLRALPTNEGYEHKCRTLSEFISVDFCGAQNKNNITEQTIHDMVEPALWTHIKPYFQASKGNSIRLDNVLSNSKASDVYNPFLVLTESGAATPNQRSWALAEAAMVVACAGITRFCLDTMDTQFDAAFSTLLNRHFYLSEHLNMSVKEADDQLRLGSLSVTGYFSPNERYTRISNHFDELRSKFL
jgi:hypothetical protein